MFRSFVAVLVGLLTLGANYAPVEFRSTPPIQYTTTALKEIPSQAVGVSVTPNASSWASSNYTQVTASTPEAWLLVGVAVVNQANANAEYEVDVATGAAASETVIGTLSGAYGAFGDAGMTSPMYFPEPIDNIPASTRVAVRIRKSGTNVTAWTISLLYYPKPEAGYIPSSTAIPTVSPSATDGLAITSNSTAWANSSYSEVTASTGSIWTIGGISICCNTGTSIELDIAIGAAASETVVTTVTTNTSGNFPAQFILIRPNIQIAAGQRIAIRQRQAAAAAATYRYKLNYIPAAGHADLTTTASQTITPGVSAGTAVVSGAGAWLNGSYVQFIASTANDIAIAGIKVAATSGSQVELDVATGAAASEVVLTTVRYTYGNGGSDGFIPFPMLATAPTGSRIAIRTRSANSSFNINYNLVHLNSATCGQCSASFQGGGLPPSAANVTIAGDATPFTSSAWGEVEDSLAADSLITALSFLPPDDIEDVAFDIGTGASSSETVITTLRVASTNNAAVGYIVLPVPHLVTAGTRIAVRFRKSDTTTTNWTLGLSIIGDTGFTNPGGFPIPYILGKLFKRPEVFLKKAA